MSWHSSVSRLAVISRLILACLVLSSPVLTLSAGELLYNGITLPDAWPPQRTPTQVCESPSYLATPPAVIQIDIGRQLFVDDFLIQSSTLQRVPHRPTMHSSNPILAPDGPDTQSFAMPYSDGAWFDPADNLYKMWYLGGNAMGISYAYSVDGVNWTKPSISDAAVPNTNIVLSLGYRDSATVWMDLNDPDPARRFKAFTFRPPNELGIYFSPDGIHWTVQSNTIKQLSDRTTVFWNPFRKVWVDSIRGDAMLPATSSRAAYNSRVRYYAESSDLLNWRPADLATSFWTGPDENDPPYVAGGALPELYNLDAVAYESLMVGLFSWYHPGPSYSPGYGAGPNLVELGVGFSRDGYSWARPTRGFAGNAFIPATNIEGTWNAFNTQSVGGGFLVVGDELWFYFSGRTLHKPESGIGSTGVARLRRDGFYSMDAGAQEGVLTTRPVRFAGNRLFVNVDNPSGQLLVEVLDLSGAVIGSFSRANCIAVSANSTIQEIHWNGVTDLASLASTPVRFRFILTNGKLYSFWVTSATNGASNGFVAAGGPGFTSPVDTVGRFQLDSTVATPSITPHGGTFAGPVQVVLADSTPGTIIRYTLDGSDPTPSSAAYSQPFTLSFSTTVKARAFLAGLSDSLVASAAFNLPDMLPPSVAVTSPANNQVVVGTVNLTATASDDVGVAGVKFGVDGTLVGSEVASPPYAQPLDTARLTNGDHQVIAVARDMAGHQTTSAAVTIKVQNKPKNDVAFLTADTTTLGNWKGVYGQDGNYIVQHSVQYPSYASFTPAGANLYVRNPYSSDVRALQKVFYQFTAAEREESYMHAVEYMDFDLSVSDNQWHRLALYFCDYEFAGRSITVEGRDAATGAVLDSRALTNYTGGVYLVYRYRGRISFRVRNNNPVATAPTASISAFFWGGAVSGVDQEPPSVAIASPANGSTIAHSVSLAASTSADVAGVQFKLDNANLGAEQTTAPFSLIWDTSTTTNGSHELAAVACDTSGNYATSAVVRVTVDNLPPVVSITSPPDGSAVSGVVNVVAAASDNVALAGVQFKVDGASLGPEKTTAPYSVQWDTAAAGGVHTLAAVGRDAAGNTATATVTVRVTNDTVPPTVLISAPVSGTTVVRVVNVSATATDNAGVAGVQFKLDGINLNSEVITPPYSISWDTTSSGNGNHTLTAVARDAAGNSSTSTALLVYVNNDLQAPSVSISTPSSGAVVAGAITVAATAADNVGVASVQFQADGTSIGAGFSAAPYSLSWNTATTANGTHALTAVARDAAGNSTTSQAVQITVDNQPPAVAVTGPASGSKVSGTVNVSATASDNHSVAGVRFRLDGTDLGAERTSAPYLIPWNTATSSNGSHTLTAVVRDLAGNTATSAPVQITVENAVLDITPPVVTITAPINGGVVGTTVAVTATASDNVGVAGVQFRLDGVNLGREITSEPYSVSWDTTTAGNGEHTLTVVARDAGGNTAVSLPVTVTVANVPSTGTYALLLGLDNTTKGDWKGVYGQDGNYIVLNSTYMPSYSEMGLSNANSAIVDAYSTDLRSLVKYIFAFRPTERIASHFYNRDYFDVTVSTKDGQSHRIALYFCDWDRAGRTVTVSALNADTSAVLYTKQLSNYLEGVYLVYSYRGRVTFRITNNIRTANGLPAASLAAVFWGGQGVPSGDSKPPAVSITSPANQASVSGNITLSANASDDVAVAGVQFRLDGVNLGAESSASPYSASWDTTLATNGQHTLTAVARDSSGNTTTSAAVVVNVSNAFVDSAPPTVSFTSPASGASLSAIVVVSAAVSDNVGVAGVQFKLDNVNLGAERTSPPFVLNWDTTTASNGPHTLTAVARDAAGNTAAASVTVTVSNGVTPANSVMFAGIDTTTLGNWKGIYGQDGNYIVQHSVQYPSYASFTPAGANLYVRNPYSSDVRALQKVFYQFTAAEREESYMHAVEYMDFDLSVSDNQWHRLALYFCDYERAGRSITVEGRDAATGAVLDSRALTNYTGGVYLVYQYRGRISFRVRNNNPVATAPTASISAFFWGGSVPSQ